MKSFDYPGQNPFQVEDDFFFILQTALQKKSNVFFLGWIEWWRTVNKRNVSNLLFSPLFSSPFFFFIFIFRIFLLVWISCVSGMAYCSVYLFLFKHFSFVLSLYRCMWIKKNLDGKNQTNCSPKTKRLLWTISLLHI